MFKKTTIRNFRPRRRSSDENDDDDALPTGKNSEFARKKTVTTNSPVPVHCNIDSLLSFDTVEEGDDVAEFKVRKSVESKRWSKLERMAKDEEKQKRKNRSKDNRVIKQEERSSSPISDHADNSHVVKEFSSRTTTEVYLSSSVRKVLTAEEIPDADTVYRARKQREKAREEGDSFIPLEDDIQRFKDRTIVHSRLVREDDNDVSDEDEPRFYSARTAVLEDETRRRTEQAEFLKLEQGDSGPESDDELARWEQEQMRKGISAQQVTLYENERAAFLALYGDGINNIANMKVEEQVQKEQEEQREPEPMEIEIEMDMIEDRKLPKIGGGTFDRKTTVLLADIVDGLRARLAENDEYLQSRQRQKERLDENLDANEAEMKQLELSTPNLKRNYTLYQEMRVYCRDLLECFDEKVNKWAMTRMMRMIATQMSSIVDLEERAISLHRNRADFLIRRRRQDIRDQYDDCSATTTTKHSSIVRTPEVAVRVAEREARRGRRRRAREKAVFLSHNEGLSSDDEEMPSQIASFRENRERLIAEARQVFADTLDEFCSVSAICSRFLNWLLTAPVSFDDAFVSTCLPKLLFPLIRVQLIDWQPLTQSSPVLNSFESSSWYRQLLSLPDSSQPSLGEHPAIVDLLPTIVEKVIVPKLTAIVSACWDPCSSAQTTRLSGLVLQLVDIYPTVDARSPFVTGLLEAVHNKAKLAVDDDLFMPVYQKESLASSMTGAKSFVNRQFWSATKLMRNCSSLEGFLSSSSIQHLIIDGIINRYIVLGLQCTIDADSAVLHQCRTVVECFSPHWFRSGTNFNAQMQSLYKVLQRIAVDKRVDGSKDVSKELHKLAEKVRKWGNKCDH